MHVVDCFCVFSMDTHQRKEAIHDEPPPFPQLPVCFARFVELERKDHGGATEHHGQSLERRETARQTTKILEVKQQQQNEQ